MKQIIPGCDTVNNVTDATYLFLMGGGTSSTSEQTVSCPVPTNGVLSELFVKLTGVVAAGASVTLTLMKNKLPTSLTCTILEGSDSASDILHTVSFSGGDTVDILMNITGSPGSIKPTWCITFEGTNPSESIVMGIASTSTGNVVSASLGGGTYNETLGRLVPKIPTSGTLKKLYGLLSMTPGVSPAGYTFNLSVGGVAQALSVVLTSTLSGNDTVDSVSVSEGSVVIWTCTPTNTPTGTPNLCYSAVFVPSRSGEFLMPGPAPRSPSTSATQFCTFISSAANWFATESGRSQMLRHVTVKKLYVNPNVPVTTGKSFTITMRNGSDTVLTCVVTDSTYGSDISHSVFIDSPTLCDWKSVPSGSPGTTLLSIMAVGVYGRIVNSSSKLSKLVGASIV